MKSILRNFFINFLAFWLIATFFSAIDFSGRISVLLFASFVLSVANLLVKPILNLIFLPLNLITMGGFRWIVNVIVLYLVTLFIPEFTIKPFEFPGFQFGGFVVPPLHFNLFWTYILISFFLSLISNIIYFLFK